MPAVRYSLYLTKGLVKHAALTFMSTALRVCLIGVFLAYGVEIRIQSAL